MTMPTETQSDETFPQAPIVLLDDSGHWSMLDEATDVEQPVLAFLRDALAPGRAGSGSPAPLDPT
jgi:pimeloyl-ACP methyl ester carboxylesterase